MHVRVDPDTILPASILLLMGVYFLSIGWDTLRRGKQSKKYTARQIALGLDRPGMTYNPKTKTIVLGARPEPLEDETLSDT